MNEDECRLQINSSKDSRVWLFNTRCNKSAISGETNILLRRKFRFQNKTTTRKNILHKKAEAKEFF